MCGENFVDSVCSFVFWKILNLFLRTITALLFFIAKKKKIAINYCVIIRISVIRAGICPTLCPHFLAKNIHSRNISDWLCRCSAPPSPCTGRYQCQPPPGFVLKRLHWPTVALIVSIMWP